MFYRAELDYLMNVLRRVHLQVMLLDSDKRYEDRLDFGLRKHLGMDVDYERAFHNKGLWAKDRTIYRLEDEFGCMYIFLILPGFAVTRALLIGPYTTEEISSEGIMEVAERLGIPVSRCAHLEEYYRGVPLIQSDSMVSALVTSFGETIWGGSDFEVINLNTDLLGTSRTLSVEQESRSTEDLMLRMKLMETRYRYENELMEAVSQGQTHRAVAMVDGLFPKDFEQRLNDSLRNKKNYLIISNTLMRKAAERGGVHPIHLDSVSADFARRIEGTTGMEKAQKLLVEMVRGYSNLVRAHSMKNYSPIVQKAVLCIASGLANDLSLSALAAVLNINASYLSTLFRKETGQTVTEYVNELRMQNGANLLETTNLQVQSIAQHCGISDVNYFSKRFKQYYGMTPKQYRQEVQAFVKMK